MTKLEILLKQVRACAACKSELPFDPKPVLRAKSSAKILVVGQAPGTKVHVSGIPWNDPSGVRLREWMNVDSEIFYDESKIAIIPMGFCYPGKGKSGDLPPRTECAKLWHEKLLKQLPYIELILLVGSYAQKYYLKNEKFTLTETVKNFRDYGPLYFPLPHPSPRNQLWFKQNPWFKKKVTPLLQRRIKKILK